MADFYWTVPADHPAFAGHFPGQPIVPGVVLLDRAILFAEQLLGQPNLNWQVANAKFFSPVGPAETLVFTLETKANGSVTFAVHAVDASDGAGNSANASRDVASGSLKPPAP